MSETPPPTLVDTEPEEISRRHFIEHVGFMSGTALLYAACKPSEQKNPRKETTVGPVVESSHRSLTNEEYDVVAAAVERICPRDEEPGAMDLGVPEYIDRALSTPTLGHVRDEFVRGTEALMRRAQTRHHRRSPRWPPPSRTRCSPSSRTRPPGAARRTTDRAHRADHRGPPREIRRYGGNRDRAAGRWWASDQGRRGSCGCPATFTTAPDQEGLGGMAFPRWTRGGRQRRRRRADGAAARARRVQGGGPREGPLLQAGDFVHDEILNSRRNFFMPLPWEEPHLFR